MLRVGYLATLVYLLLVDSMSGGCTSSSNIWKDLVRIIWNQWTTDLVLVKE